MIGSVLNSKSFPIKQIQNTQKAPCIAFEGLTQDKFECKSKNLTFGGKKLEVPVKEFEKVGKIAKKKMMELTTAEEKIEQAYTYLENIEKIFQENIKIENVKNRDFEEIKKHPNDALKLRFSHELLGSYASQSMYKIELAETTKEINSHFNKFVDHINSTSKRYNDIYAQKSLPRLTLGADRVFELAMEAIEKKAADKNIKISVENAEILKEHVNAMKGGDGNNYDIMSNLLLNAVKYSPENSHIKTGFDIKENKLLFYVEDEGIGIKPEDQQKVLTGKRGSNVGTIFGEGFGLYSISSTLREGHLPPLKITSPLKPNSEFPGSRLECFLISNCNKTKAQIIFEKFCSK